MSQEFIRFALEGVKTLYEHRNDTNEGKPETMQVTVKVYRSEQGKFRVAMYDPGVSAFWIFLGYLTFASVRLNCLSSVSTEVLCVDNAWLLTDRHSGFRMLYSSCTIAHKQKNARSTGSALFLMTSI